MTDNDIAFLTRLERVIASRIESNDEHSYTASLATAGVKRISQKLGEEAVETALAATSGNHDEFLDEAADLVYHLLVLLRARECSLADVARVLEARHSP
ncbi:MAG: phosphoribosyl-ATP diphosphatase [Woeseiaceae bacterium]|nr:phosphoribosyl-ATP diphosphatase [Woeseiaceae bacterium]